MSISRTVLLVAVSFLATVASSAFGKDIWVEADGKPKAGEVRVDFAIVSLPEKEGIVLLAGDEGKNAALFQSIQKRVDSGVGRVVAASGETVAEGARMKLELGPDGGKTATVFEFIAKRWDGGGGANLQVRLVHFLEGGANGADRKGDIVPGETGSTSEGAVTTADCRAGEPLMLAEVRPPVVAGEETAGALHFVFVKIELGNEDER